MYPKTYAFHIFGDYYLGICEILSEFRWLKNNNLRYKSTIVQNILDCKILSELQKRCFVYTLCEDILTDGRIGPTITTMRIFAKEEQKNRNLEELLLDENSITFKLNSQYKCREELQKLMTKNTEVNLKYEGISQYFYWPYIQVPDREHPGFLTEEYKRIPKEHYLEIKKTIYFLLLHEIPKEPINYVIVKKYCGDITVENLRNLEKKVNKQESVLILRDLVDIMSDPVTIEIDCEPVNNYIAEIHGFSTKLLFENVYLNENIIKEYLNNEVWSISGNHINIRNNDKTIYCDKDKKIETVKENGKVKEKNHITPIRDAYDYL